MAPRLNGFISYSTIDRHRAAEVKVALSALGIDAFMAHDDLHVSELWRTRIVEELERMDVFVPLLSSAFKASEWASQEVGYAIARPATLIIPVTLDKTVPYGFLGILQARTLPDPVVPEFFRPALTIRFPRTLIGIMIDELAGAQSFRDAEAKFRPLLSHLGSLTVEEATRIAQVSLGNREIWDSAGCATEYLPAFLNKNRHQIPPDVAKALGEQIGLVELK